VTSAAGTLRRFRKTALDGTMMLGSSGYCRTSSLWYWIEESDGMVHPTHKRQDRMFRWQFSL